MAVLGFVDLYLGRLVHALASLSVPVDVTHTFMAPCGEFSCFYSQWVPNKKNVLKSAPLPIRVYKIPALLKVPVSMTHNKI